MADIPKWEDSTELEEQTPTWEDSTEVEEKELPVKQEQGVSVLDRAGIKNLIDESPELQDKYLEKKGYDVRRRKGQIQVKKPGDKEWKVVDPEGFDVQDITDHIGDVISAGAALAGFSTGGIIGAGGASGAAEAARQAAGTALGLRDDVDYAEIGKATGLGLASGAFAGTAGAVGKGLTKAVKAVSKKIDAAPALLKSIAKRISNVSFGTKAAAKYGPKAIEKGGKTGLVLGEPARKKDTSQQSVAERLGLLGGKKTD